MRRHLLTLLLALLVTTVAGCSGDSDNPRPSQSGDSMNAKNDDLVCGLVSTELVRRVVGDAPIKTRGRGAEAGSGEPAQCTILNGERTQSVMQLSIGEVDPAEWKPKLAQEAEGGYGECRTRYDGDPGVGYGCTYDSGVFVAGAAVHVLNDNRLIRATVYNWADASPAERLALAQEAAREMNKNYAASRD